MSVNSIPFLPRRVEIKRGVAFGLLLVTALIAFEIFNYSTTDFALTDLLGQLRFWGVRWSTILSVAFCGIDFAGIARLFTPEQRDGEGREIWYLFAAWLLAATMNALLTWWGVSLAILNHETLGNAVIARGTLLRVVPIFVAVMIWLLRVLIIGLFSVAGERYFGRDQLHVEMTSLQARRAAVSSRKPSSSSRKSRSAPSPPSSRRRPSRPEPTYQPLNAKSSAKYSQ